MGCRQYPLAVELRARRAASGRTNISSWAPPGLSSLQSPSNVSVASAPVGNLRCTSARCDPSSSRAPRPPAAARVSASPGYGRSPSPIRPRPGISVQALEHCLGDAAYRSVLDQRLARSDRTPSSVSRCAARSSTGSVPARCRSRGNTRRAPSRPAGHGARAAARGRRAPGHPSSTSHDAGRTVAWFRAFRRDSCARSGRPREIASTEPRFVSVCKHLTAERSINLGRGVEMRLNRGGARKCGLGLAVLLVLAAVSFSADAASPRRPALSISVLSGRADLVTGGSALVAINLPTRSDAHHVHVTLGRSNVTKDSRSAPTAASRAGDRRPRGGSVLQAMLPNGWATQIKLINHPIGGPVFSGPQLEPWTCSRAQSTSSAIGAEFKYEYMSTDPSKAASSPTTRRTRRPTSPRPQPIRA